jgi:hypothetical protein
LKDTQGQTHHSFKILTINAVSHALMNPLHKPADEKSSSVTLPPQRYDNRLQASSKVRGSFCVRGWRGFNSK